MLKLFPESGSWDTSKALVRRTLQRCIETGRRHRAQGMKQDEYEAYRLLGQAVRYTQCYSTLWLTLVVLASHIGRFPCPLKFLRACARLYGLPRCFRSRGRSSSHTSSQWSTGGAYRHWFVVYEAYNNVNAIWLMFPGRYIRFQRFHSQSAWR